MREKTYSIGVNKECFDKFVALNEKRTQDKTRADTFAHILYVYEEQFFKSIEQVHANVSEEKP